MTASQSDRVSGTVVAERELSEQNSSFARAVENQLHFRDLQGGTYKLVRVDESGDSTKDPAAGRTMRMTGGSVTGESTDATLRLTAEFDEQVDEFEARKILRRVVCSEVRVTEAGLRPAPRNNSRTADD